MLLGKRIILGVCGSIAAYKSALIIRLLVKEGAEVRVIMTDSAKDFVTPLTLATLSKNPVLSEFANTKSGEWNNHVELGLWANFILIAPASANTLAKMAHGLCDNLLTATYLSARCPVVVAPAMDLDMYDHPSTRANLKALESYGNVVIEAEVGELASGLSGAGRMSEPETLIQSLKSLIKKKSSESTLAGKKVLITAGPTYEAIDPVRYIGNYSSGKMGYALANQAAALGANVVLVSGPTGNLHLHALVNRIPVTSASEMYSHCAEEFPTSDITILAAAVADYRPAEIAHEKIKKGPENMSIALVKTVDIAATLGISKKKDQLLVGFALETNNEEANALEKLARKNFDLIILNSLQNEGAGFGHDTNQITILSKNNKKIAFPLKSKASVATDILEAISNFRI